MNNRKYLRWCGAILALTLVACSEAKTENADEGGVETVLPNEENEVTIQVLQKQLFEHELVTNGKVNAGRQADLKFQTNGIVAHIYVKNGDYVRQGQKLAELDKFKLNNQTAQAKDALEQAKLELKDVLIGQGYPADDHTNVPEDIMQLARVKSGYDQRVAQYEMAKYEEENATLTAPFDGRVANLFAKTHNATDASTPFCTILGTKQMEIDFTVLENELTLIRKGDKVVVTPYADAEVKYEGRISEINPLVEEKGMVKVKATVDGRENLFSGMNVRIHIHRTLDEQVVIPKSAVVLRSGKQVVFTLKKGRAYWNYVQTGLENSQNYSLVEMADMKLGDTIIVTGNVNLAHEAPVKVTMVNNE